MTQTTLKTYIRPEWLVYSWILCLCGSALTANAQKHATHFSKAAITGMVQEFSRIRDRPLTQIDIVHLEHALMRLQSKKSPWTTGNSRKMSVFGRVFSENPQRTVTPESLVMLAKDGFDAESLVQDLLARRINPYVFADRIAWYGYTDLTGTIVIPDLPKGVSLSALAVKKDFRLAPFSIATRSEDPDRIELCPITLYH